RFATSAARTSRIDELDELVTAWSGSLSTDDAVKRMHAHNVPSAPVCTIPQVADSPQVEARRMLVTMQDSLSGPQRVIGNPLKMSALDNDATPTEPPLLGADTDAVLSELLGYDAQQIADLERAHVIARRPNTPTPAPTSADHRRLQHCRRFRE